MENIENLVDNFHQFGLHPAIIQSIDKLDYITPTPVQQQAIPVILNTTDDLLALAQTGTGKTAAFGLPMLNMIDRSSKKIQALILCPTRELCLQITADLKSYCRELKQINIVPVYGGSSIENQVKGIKRGAQIVVGTPGRVNDLMKRGFLNFTPVNWFILDEADEMLRMGFKDELDAIKEGLPEQYRTLLFSATMPANMRNWLNNPVEITVGKRNVSAEQIDHHYYFVDPKQKYDALKRILDANPDLFSIIFCRTREECRVIAEQLIAAGYRADALHGDLTQSQRDYVMNRFRKKYTSILVATDIAARGLDVNHLTHIINYHLPDDPEAYVHRSGRCGRAGRTGIAISLVNPRRRRHLSFLERLAGKKFEQKKIPTGEEICSIQLLHTVDKIVNTEVDQEQLSFHQALIYEKLSQFERPELINRVIATLMGNLLEEYKDVPDLNPPDQNSRSGFSTLSLNIGQRDSLTPPRLIALINQLGDQYRVKLGKIDIGHKNTLFEVDRRYESFVLEGIGDLLINGKSVRVKVTQKSPIQERQKRQRYSKHPDRKRQYAKRKRQK